MKGIEKISAHIEADAKAAAQSVLDISKPMQKLQHRACWTQPRQRSTRSRQILTRR